jgi:hypothetical protein
MVHMKTGSENTPQDQPGPQEVTAVAPEKLEDYDLHTRIPGEMKDKLAQAVELAYRLGLIEKPALVNLMNLWILWGMELLKRKWYERMGYK